MGRETVPDNVNLMHDPGIPRGSEELTIVEERSLGVLSTAQIMCVMLWER